MRWCFFAFCGDVVTQTQTAPRFGQILHRPASWCGRLGWGNDSPPVFPCTSSSRYGAWEGREITSCVARVACVVCVVVVSLRVRVVVNVCVCVRENSHNVIGHSKDVASASDDHSAHQRLLKLPKTHTSSYTRRQLPGAKVLSCTHENASILFLSRRGHQTRNGREALAANRSVGDH